MNKDHLVFASFIIFTVVINIVIAWQFRFYDAVFFDIGLISGWFMIIIVAIYERLRTPESNWENKGEQNGCSTDKCS